MDYDVQGFSHRELTLTPPTRTKSRPPTSTHVEVRTKRANYQAQVKYRIVPSIH